MNRPSLHLGNGQLDHVAVMGYIAKLEEAICYLSYKLDQHGVCNDTQKCAERNMTCYTCWKEWSMKDE